jgi:hypothetical protein
LRGQIQGDVDQFLGGVRIDITESGNRALLVDRSRTLHHARRLEGTHWPLLTWVAALWGGKHIRTYIVVVVGGRITIVVKLATWVVTVRGTTAVIVTATVLVITLVDVLVVVASTSAVVVPSVTVITVFPVMRVGAVIVVVAVVVTVPGGENFNSFVQI